MPFLFFRCYSEKELEQTGEILLDVGDDDLFERGLGANLLHIWVHQAEDDDRLGAGVVQLVLDLAGYVCRVARDDDTADHQCGIIGDDKLRAIGEIKSHPVTLLDP